MNRVAPRGEVLHREVEELIHAYVQCIDDDELEKWPDFFTEKCLYKIIPRENVEAGLPSAAVFCDSRAMLVDRIVALRNANIYPSQWLRHLVSNTRILDIDARAGITAQTNYAVFQTRNDGSSHVFSVGKYRDLIVRDDGGQLKFKQRVVTYDTHRIETLMVIPI